MEELQLRAAVLVNPDLQISQELQEQVCRIAAERSPSATFNLAQQAAILAGLGQMDALGVAKAARWLAVIRRDYSQKGFDQTVRALINTTP